MDEMDRAQEEEERHREQAIAQARRAALGAAARAPRKRKCAVCGWEIPAPRLEAAPGADHCVDCQREFEAELVH